MAVRGARGSVRHVAVFIRKLCCVSCVSARSRPSNREQDTNPVEPHELEGDLSYIGIIHYC